jgi:hypothetical protein
MDDRGLDVVRVAVAAVAAALIVGDALLGARRPRARRAITGGLGLCAAAAALVYARFGEPQFRDEAAARPTWVHLWDTSVYFPAAKYFDELGFDGLYLADAAALAENHGATPARRTKAASPPQSIAGGSEPSEGFELTR